MQYPQDFERDAVEDYRRFPEWAERPPGVGSMREGERNSYFAGGYAEQFGRRVRSALRARAISAAVDADGN